MKFDPVRRYFAAVVAGVLIGGLLAAVPAAADPVDPYYTIINANSGKCLAIGGSSMADGAAAIQWPCLNIDDQRWYSRPSTGGSVRLVNVNSGKCLAIGASSNDDGAAAIQWPCLNIDDQRWYLHDANGARTVTNRHSGQCLAIGASSLADGAAAIQWPCLNIDDQRWYLNYHG